VNQEQTGLEKIKQMCEQALKDSDYIIILEHQNNFCIAHRSIGTLPILQVSDQHTGLYRIKTLSASAKPLEHDLELSKMKALFASAAETLKFVEQCYQDSSAYSG